MTVSNGKRLREILDGFGTYSRWYGFDEALDTKGKHTSSTPTEAIEAAEQAILSLVEQEIAEELSKVAIERHPINCPCKPHLVTKASGKFELLGERIKALRTEIPSQYIGDPKAIQGEGRNDGMQAPNTEALEP